MARIREKLVLVTLDTVMAYLDWILIPALCQARILELLIEILFVGIEGVPSVSFFR
jgi:hypothetical protein